MINFYYNYPDFSLKNDLQYKLWIENCIENFELETGEISYTFVDDEELLEINKDLLNHDFYTDIITIDQRVGDIVSADIFISIDRIKDNSKELKTDFSEELKRVIIHGLLHIVGFNDHSDKEKTEMRKQEDFCIALF
jgi:rRNA maturation RNase YbeY